MSLGSFIILHIRWCKVKYYCSKKCVPRPICPGGMLLALPVCDVEIVVKLEVNMTRAYFIY